MAGGAKTEPELTDCERKEVDQVLNMHEDVGTTQYRAVDTPVAASGATCESVPLSMARKRQRETQHAREREAWKRRKTSHAGSGSSTPSNGDGGASDDDEDDNYCLGALQSQRDGRPPAVATDDLPNLYRRCKDLIYGENKSVREGLCMLEAAARAGYAPAQLHLGRLLLDGYEGVPANHTEALAWITKSALQKHAPALLQLAKVYHHGLGGVAKSHEVAEGHLRAAAAMGLAEAQYYLGYIVSQEPIVPCAGLREITQAEQEAEEEHRPGESVDRGRMEEAFQLFTKAALQGHCKAQTKLGIMYFKGNVAIKKDDKKAFEWYSKAAQGGFAEAQTNLGLMYFNGHGVAQDTVLGARWLRAAATQGYARAQTTLGLLLTKGVGIQKDTKEAASWFRQAGRLGCPVSQCHLGMLYEAGDGVRKDSEAAIFWLSKAAYQGQQMAIYRLGAALLNAGLVEQGIHMLELPAKAGCKVACEALLQHHGGVVLLITLGALILPTQRNPIAPEVTQQVVAYCRRPSNTSKLIMQFAAEAQPLSRLLLLDAIVRFASVPQLHLIFITSGHLYDLERALLGSYMCEGAAPPPEAAPRRRLSPEANLAADNSVTDALTQQEVASCVLRVLYKNVVLQSDETRLKFDFYEEVPFVKQLFCDANSSDVEICLVSSAGRGEGEGEKEGEGDKEGEGEEGCVQLAHRLILSQYPYFKKAFDEMDASERSGKGRARLEVEGVSPAVFRILLKFMYKYNVDEDIAESMARIMETLMAAKRFELDGLHERCVMLVAHSMKLPDLQQVYEQACAADDGPLLDVCLNFGMRVLPLLMNRWLGKKSFDGDLTKAAVILFLVEKGCKMAREQIILKQQRLTAAEARQGQLVDLV